MSDTENGVEKTALLGDPVAQTLNQPTGTEVQAFLQPEHAKSVFINCPFDEEFEPLFQAIIFAVDACGFTPRSALESGTVAELRMERIKRAIFSSKYSIHDLSRYRGEGDQHLARFNMPLELGMAIAHQYFGYSKDNQHDWAALVPQGNVYVKVISDLAGYDLLRYDGTVETIVQKVMSWLVTRPDASRKPSPRKVLGELPVFTTEVARLKEHWGPEPIWADIVEAAVKTALRF